MAINPQIPNGWIAHDGNGCPVPLWTMPGVLFRSGGRYEPGRMKAAVWGTVGIGKPDLWKHEGEQTADIIAYLPEEPKS